MFFNLFMPESLGGQPDLAGHSKVAEAHSGHSIQGCKVLSELWRSTWASTLEFNAAALELLRVFQGLLFSRVPPMPGPRLDVVPSPGWHSLPSFHSLTSLSILPLFLSHFHIPIFPSNLFLTFHQDLPAKGPLQRCSHQQWQRLGQRSPAGGRGEELAPLFGSKSDWNSADSANTAGSISS